jgi:hypothetical protein
MHCSYSIVNLSLSYPFNRDLMVQIERVLQYYKSTTVIAIYMNSTSKKVLQSLHFNESRPNDREQTL